MASTTKTLLTLQEFERIPDDGMRHELSRGELIVMPQPVAGHGKLSQRVAKIFFQYLLSHPLGELYFNMGFQLGPETVRGPDLAFLTNVSIARMDDTRWFLGAPDLAIEIVSPSNSAADLNQKIDEYLEAGARSIWVIYPRTRRVNVFRPDGALILRAADSLTEPELLPGLSIPIATLFD